MAQWDNLRLKDEELVIEPTSQSDFAQFNGAEQDPTELMEDIVNSVVNTQPVTTPMHPSAKRHKKALARAKAEARDLTERLMAWE